MLQTSGDRDAKNLRAKPEGLSSLLFSNLLLLYPVNFREISDEIKCVISIHSGVISTRSILMNERPGRSDLDVIYVTTYVEK